MNCPRCGRELVEVDNPLRREVRHRRGVMCRPLPEIPEGIADDLIIDRSPVVVREEPDE